MNRIVINLLSIYIKVDTGTKSKTEEEVKKNESTNSVN